MRIRERFKTGKAKLSAILIAVGAVKPLWQLFAFILDLPGRRDALAAYLRRLPPTVGSWWFSPLLIICGFVLLSWDIRHRQKSHGNIGETTMSSSTALTSPGETTRQVPSAPATSGQGRIFVGDSITPKYLIGLYKQAKMELHAQRAVEPFIGKWTTVSGPLDDVRTGLLNNVMVTILSDSSIFPNVYLYLFFDDGWLDRLSIVKHGEKISAIGEIKKVSQHFVVLENCELVG
jgi:hypothetical protein